MIEHVHCDLCAQPFPPASVLPVLVRTNTPELGDIETRHVCSGCATACAATLDRSALVDAQSPSPFIEASA